MDASFAAPDEMNRLTPDLFHDLGWTPLRAEAPAGSALPPVGVPVAVAARDFGVALIDFAPDRVDGAAERLRRRLDAVSFAEDFPGFLPVAHVTLDEADRWRLSSVLDHAFAQVEPIGVAAGGWIARVQDALVTTAAPPGPVGPDPAGPDSAGLDPVGPDPVEHGRVAAERPAVAVPRPSVAAVLAPPVPTEPLLLRVPAARRRRRLRGVVAFWGLVLLAGGLGALALQSYGPPSLPMGEVPASQVSVAQVPASQASGAQAPGAPRLGAPASGAPAAGAQGSGTRNPGSQNPGTQVTGAQTPGAPASRAPAVGRGASGLASPGAEPRAAEAPGMGGTTPPSRPPAASVPTEAAARGLTPPGDTAWVNPDAPGAPDPVGPPRDAPQGEEAGPDDGPRIVIHHAAADAGNAQRLARVVGGGAAPEMRSVPATPTTPAVRYFHPGDRRAAEELVSRLGKGWRVHDFTSFSPRPSRPTLEVWIPEGRGAPRVAPTAPGGADRPPPREALGGIY